MPTLFSDILERHGPFIGIMGSSTGATVAAVVTFFFKKGDRAATLISQQLYPSITEALSTSD